MTQDRHGDLSTSEGRLVRKDSRLEGTWLHLARGAWIIFVLSELLVFCLTLVATGVQDLTICPFIVSCTVTDASAQALRHVAMSQTSYATYNLVLALLQSLVFLSTGGFIFWRKSSEPVALAASLFLVSAGLVPFFPSTIYPPAVILSYIAVPIIFAALGYFLLTFPDGRFVPRRSWLLVALWFAQAIVFQIPGPLNIIFWPALLFAAEQALTYGGTIGVLIYRYARVFSYAQRQQAKWLLFGFAGLVVLTTLYSIIGSLVPGLGAPDSLYQLANGTISTITFLFLPLSIGITILRTRLWDIDVLIRRTLVYSALTVILTLIYVALVLSLGTHPVAWPLRSAAAESPGDCRLDAGDRGPLPASAPCDPAGH